MDRAELEKLVQQNESGGVDGDAMQKTIDNILQSAQGPPRPDGTLSKQQIDSFNKAGAEVRRSAGKRLASKYFASPKKASEVMRKASGSAREGDHDDAILGAYSKFFETFNPGPPPPSPANPEVLGKWLTDLSRNELFTIFAVFRSQGRKQDVPDVVHSIHEMYCDMFEYHFASHGFKNDDNTTALEVIEFFHLVSLTCKMVFKENHAPPRPVQAVEMLMDNVATVTPILKLLIACQKAKDMRQAITAPASVEVFPDQTVWCDFVVWSYHFYTFLTALFVKHPHHKKLMSESSDMYKPSPVDETYSETLDKLVGQTLDLAKDGETPRGKGRGFLYVHQLDQWLTLSSMQGLKVRPWVVDLVYDPELKCDPVRLGSPPFFGRKPSWTAQLVALFETILKSSSDKQIPLPASVSFMTLEDSAAAQKMLPKKPISIGCNTNTVLDRASIGVLARELDKSTFPVSTPEKDAKRYWMDHAEPLCKKGGITLEYLKMWYQKAASFYRLKPWTKCPEQCVLEVEVNGIGTRNVVISGSSGGPLALRLFKPSKVPDLQSKHDALVFTHEANCPFADIQQVVDYSLEIADTFGIPNLFSGYDIFKRPPFAELEMYRATFDVLAEFFSKHELTTDMMADKSQKIRESCDIEVLGEAHPRRAEVYFPAQIYQQEEEDNDSANAPRKLPSAIIDQAFVAEEATEAVCAAYDKVLDLLVNDKKSEAKAAVAEALTLNGFVAPYLLFHKPLPDYSTWKEEGKPEGKARTLVRQAVAYAFRSHVAWLSTDGALPWLETEAIVARPNMTRLTKCSNGGCMKAGSAKVFKKCSACQQASYCSVNCQRAHWPTHKLACKKIASVA